MRLIGQRVTQLHVERYDVEPGKKLGNIESNATPKGVKKGEGKIGNNIPVIFDYEFSSKYTIEESDALAAELKVKGEVVFEMEEKESETAIKEWKKNKVVPKDQMNEVLQGILISSQMYAISLAKDMNLPSPVPLPRVQMNQK